MTNFEKIKNMNVDQMSNKLDELFACDRCPIVGFCDKNNSTPGSSCTYIWKKWLESEVEDFGNF